MRAQREAFNAKRNQFFLDEGALALVQADQRARDALTFSEGRTKTQTRRASSDLRGYFGAVQPYHASA